VEITAKTAGYERFERRWSGPGVELAGISHVWTAICHCR